MENRQLVPAGCLVPRCSSNGINASCEQTEKLRAICGGVQEGEGCQPQIKACCFSLHM